MPKLRRRDPLPTQADAPLSDAQWLVLHALADPTKALPEVPDLYRTIRALRNRGLVKGGVTHDSTEKITVAGLRRVTPFLAAIPPGTMDVTCPCGRIVRLQVGTKVELHPPADTPPVPPTPCRRCTECTGMLHHWVEGRHGYVCKHCPLRGEECDNCCGTGCIEDDECGACCGQGVQITGTACAECDGDGTIDVETSGPQGTIEKPCRACNYTGFAPPGPVPPAMECPHVCAAGAYCLAKWRPVMGGDMVTFQPKCAAFRRLGASCDWGGCNSKANLARWSPTDGWLAVCRACSRTPVPGKAKTRQ